jgi:hypothetical protein
MKNKARVIGPCKTQAGPRSFIWNRY